MALRHGDSAPRGPKEEVKVWKAPSAGHPTLSWEEAGVGGAQPCVPDVMGRSLLWLGSKVCKSRSGRETESKKGPRPGRHSQQHPAALRFTWHGLQKRRSFSG